MEKDLAQFIAEEMFDPNLSAIDAIADMIRPILEKWNSARPTPTPDSLAAMSTLHDHSTQSAAISRVKYELESSKAQQVVVNEGSDQTLSAEAAPTPDSLAQSTLTHSRSCPELTPMSDEACTCGLQWRIALQTEQTMHAAWRKRAEEAELKLDAAPTPDERAALQRYGSHDPSCPEFRQKANRFNEGCVQDSAFACNCGFDAARASVSQGVAAEQEKK